MGSSRRGCLIDNRARERNIRAPVRVLLMQRSEKGANVSRRLSLSLALVGLLLASIGCRTSAPKVRRTISRDKKVELGRAESTQVSVAMGIGKLSISGGAEGALDARFDYEIPEWKPVVTYEVEKGLGRLAVKQPDSKVGAKTDVRYDWRLRLSGKVPTDLVIEMGTGSVNLDTRGVNLRRLKVAVAVGEGRIDLSDVTSSLNAKIESGVGELELLVPSDVGVMVRADGIGHVQAPDLTKGDEGWTNAAWGKSKASVNVDVSGIGEVRIETVARQTI